ncbi:intradiol ring-cleavage dioxygenase [Saccharopolyspora gloriosae]|uniref:intradiol ring-cleavage dioxygenase n=1 Tax=Saccharopolyspora gloriosae TaxID=455344 RepID=UPI001FB675BF|nr:intradiol ring-cleavage dioxygenase [Saccharopolyspora gloriosae]
MPEHQSAQPGSPENAPHGTGTSRRTALAAFGGLGAAAIGLNVSAASAHSTPASSGQRWTPSCVLAPEQMEGPYYLDYGIRREDITEDREGLDLLLKIVVVDADSCLPLPDVAVDIWHCDALGVYSSYTGYGNGILPPVDENGHAAPTDETTWLRGVQLTDAAGVASFRSIVPGWYTGRAVHIHVKTVTGAEAEGATVEGGHVSHTGQLYFPERFNAELGSLAPYRENRIERVTNDEDVLYTGGGEGAVSELDVKPGPFGRGITGTIVLGIQPDATPPPDPMPPMPPPGTN